MHADATVSTYPDLDKLERYGPGPWLDEPDRVEWRAHGLPCLMLRQKQLGHWCGYVAVPPGHPWHGRDIDFDCDVHGGLTYASACNGDVCHVPAPGEPDDVWWLGFDCAHAWDLLPGKGRLLPVSSFHDDGVYWTLELVMRETEQLARQCAEAT